MKIAMCMYGIVGGQSGENGAGETVDIEKCYDTYKKHIFEKNDPIDIFVHTWSVCEKERINNLYKPARMMAEPQEQFVVEDAVLLDAEFRVKSRWVSTMRSLQQKSEHEKDGGFKYDCVMVNRFDIEFLSDLILADYDMNKMWCSMDLKYPNPGTGEREGLFLQDMWLFSNSDAMDYVGTLGGIVKNNNGHKALYQHLINKMSISDVGKYPSIDYDLYRWRNGTANDVPRKWYRHPRAANNESLCDNCSR